VFRVTPHNRNNEKREEEERRSTAGNLISFEFRKKKENPTRFADVTELSCIMEVFTLWVSFAFWDNAI